MVICVVVWLPMPKVVMVEVVGVWEVYVIPDVVRCQEEEGEVLFKWW